MVSLYNDMELMQKLNWLIQNSDKLVKPGPQGTPGNDGIAGPAGNPGRDGSPDEPMTIAEKLNTLKDVLNADVIKGMPTLGPINKRLDAAEKKLSKFNYYQVGAAGGAGSGSSVSVATVQAIPTGATGTITAWNSIVEVTTAGTNMALTFPANDTGKFIYLKKVDAGAGIITATLSGGETIILTQRYDAVLVANDGTVAYVIANYRVPSPFLALTANTTLSGASSSITADATGGAFTVTLPAAAAGNNLNVISITKIDVSTNTVTVAGALTAISLTDQNDAVMLRSNGTAWVSLSGHSVINPSGSISPWIAATVYTVGDTVSINGVIYYANTAHTSAATFTLAEQANWSVLSNYTDIPAWTGATVYPAGKLLTQGTRIIKTTAALTSAATFTNAEAANYTLVSNDTIGSFIATTYFYAGEKIFQGGIIYQRIASGISGATFNAAEAATWTPFTSSGASISAWTGAIYYEAGTFVTQGTRVLYRLASGTSAATFTSAEAATWGLISNEGIAAWVASTYYYATEQVIAPSGATIQKIASGVSTATFDATEAALWNLIENGTNASAFTGTRYYFAGDFASTTNRIVRRTAGGVAAATFTNAEAALWTLVSATGTATWTATTYYYATELAVINSKIVKRTTSGISNGVFQTAEGANWTLVSTALAPWLATSFYYINERAYTPTTLDIVVTIGGTSSATFDAAEVAGLAWAIVNVNGNAQAWTTGIYYFVGDMVSNAGSTYRRSIAGVSGATFNAAEKLNFTLNTGRPVTTVTTNYTLVETDDTLNVTGAGPLTITVPAGRVNFEFHVNRLHPNPVTAITIATSGAETIVNPATGTAATSTTVPGIASTYATIDYSLIGTVWCAA